MRDMTNRNERISYYVNFVYDRVQGWLRREIVDVIRIVGDIQERHEVGGHIVEFGVHHGKFLLLIDALREVNERTIAVDLFDRQELSPHEQEFNNLKYLRENIALLPWKTVFDIHSRDTLSLRPGVFLDVKFFSVDAGHTPVNAFNDLVIAQEALVPGGIIAFDDYFCPCWPGATEGLFNFMRRANRRLKPLFSYKGKLFLTTASEHQTLLPEYREMLAPIAPNAVIRTVCGYDCLVMSWDGF